MICEVHECTSLCIKSMYQNVKSINQKVNYLRRKYAEHIFDILSVAGERGKGGYRAMALQTTFFKKIEIKICSIHLNSQ